MRPLATVFEIPAYVFDAARRRHRFRCQQCMMVIGDGERVVVERRKGGAHGYHGDCWDRAVASSGLSSAKAASLRAEGRS